MKYSYDHEIDIPLEEKIFIMPELRSKLFYNLIDNFKVFCPNIKMIYAYLNMNGSIPADYLLIFTAVNINNIKYIIWECPYLYSNKTIPAYRYICKNKLYTDFFKYCEESMCRMEYSKFIEYINSNFCNLSSDSKSSKYWKLPSNAEILLKALLDLSLQYTPQPGQKGVRASAYSKKQMIGS